jgi:hypothetical protein
MASKGPTVTLLPATEQMVVDVERAPPTVPFLIDADNENDDGDEGASPEPSSLTVHGTLTEEPLV